MTNTTDNRQGWGTQTGTGGGAKSQSVKPTHGTRRTASRKIAQCADEDRGPRRDPLENAQLAAIILLAFAAFVALANAVADINATTPPAQPHQEIQR